MSAPATTKNGHLPTLVASFLHFDVSFMLWVLLGSLGIFIAESAGLSASQKGLMVAVPILSGSLLRIPQIGLLSDRIGGKRTGVVLLASLFVPLSLGWLAGNSLSTLLGVGLLLGTAGASFAVALPLASRWYPPERQGLVLGIAAVGNSGVVVANLLAPRLAVMVGWHNVLGLTMVPLAVVLVAFLLLAKDSPSRPDSPKKPQYLAALRHGDLWWLCIFYSGTFGGFVGLSSFLPMYLHDQYHVSPVAAGYLTALAGLVGSLIRPLGGYMADRFSGARILSLMLLGIGGFYVLASQSLPLGIFMGLIIAGMTCLGLGSGAVFQLVPGRFLSEIGVTTGVVGALGGLGGFFLPILLGNAKEATGSFGPGLLILAGLAFGAFLSLRALSYLQEGWRTSWRAPLGSGAVIPRLEPAQRVLMAPYLLPQGA